MIGSYKFGFQQILGWWLDGLWRHICATLGMTWFLPENESPPAFWYEWFSWWDWIWNLSPTGKVNSTITRNWLWACHRFWGRWTEAVADDARLFATSTVRGWYGYVLHGYETLQEWVDAIRGRVGTWVPSFATNLAQAAYLLWLWLPADITSGLVSFYDKFSAWHDAALDWVRGYVDTAKAWAYGAYAWVLGMGETLKVWYNNVHAWLDDFRANTYWRVTQLLGNTWTWTQVFFESAGIFWYNQWAWYGAEIGAFWGDPLGWLYDRVEDELCRRW